MSVWDSLRRIPLLASYSDEDLGAIAEFADEAHVPAGHCFARPGQGREAFLVVSGESVLSVPGAPQVHPSPGALLGNYTPPLGVTATAVTSMELLVLRERALRALLDGPARIPLRLALVLPELVQGHMATPAPA